MVDHKLKGVFGARNKSSSHGSSRSIVIEEKSIADLKILTQNLQKRLRLYEDSMSMGEYEMKKEKYDFYEETLQLNQLQGLLKAKGMYT